MKYLFTICLAALFFTITVFSQAKNVTHKVEKGETITQIAQKYSVTPHDIYQLNPDAVTGLKPNSVLLIPNKASKPITVAKPKVVPTTKINTSVQTHKVEPKETLFGIEKKYNVSDEALKKTNPELEKVGLEIGQTLTIPSNPVPKMAAPTPEKVVYHEVLPKETKYSIAKQYGITIAELEKRNPEIIPNLPIGYKLIIKGNTPKPSKVEVAESKKETPKSNPAKVSKKIEYSNYEIKPKETLYSLSKKFGISQEELIALNPALSKGVNDGMVLKIPSVNSIPQETKKPVVSLSYKNANHGRKKIALLMPFNLPKIESDTVNSTSTRLKKDKFLNMTLDFYSGALVAIDSARSLGIQVDVQLFDSQETKNTSNVASIIKENHLEDDDAIIGPFYQNNIEKTAEILAKNDVPVISPLSKDIGNSSPNLYQTIPTADVLKNAIFGYMNSKGGNSIAVVDKKKESTIQFIKKNHKEVQFATMNDNGSLSPESLKKMFVKERINYVVLETGNTMMIKLTIKTMLDAIDAGYNMQLVILEPNETLETDEINFLNLVKVKLMYPSTTRENRSPEALVFENEYRKKNNIYPSSYATRGFDVTFDTLTRLSHDKSYQETAETLTTDQVDNKFKFYRKENGGYANKGVFILYYDTDLTIKEAK